MAKRGSRRPKRSFATKSTRSSNPPAEQSHLRHPSQILSDSDTHKTKSTGPSTVTYRPNVLDQNNILISYLPRDPQDIKFLVKSLTFMANTVLAHENDFIENANDLRITADESTLTVGNDIPSRMRQIASRLPLLSLDVEKNWEMDIGAPLLSPLKVNDKLRVSGGTKWSMIYDAPGEALPLSTPVPDYVCSISTQPQEFWERDVGIDYEVLRKLQEKRIPYSANSSLKSLIYPFLIVEMKSEMGNLLFAENQAGSSVAISLTLLRRLREEAHSHKKLPVFVLASQGRLWQVYVAYEHSIRNKRYIKISKFLLEDIENPEGAHRLMVVLDRIKEWAMNTYIPTVKEMINSIVSSG